MNTVREFFMLNHVIGFLCLFFLLFGCKEFYDEEFEDFEQRRREEVSDQEAFLADLVSTDSSLGSLSGTGLIEFSGESATIEVSLRGIPGNLNQMTYKIITAPCASLSLPIPQSNLEDRSFESTEGLTRSALLEDLRSTDTNQNELTLSGKSFIVRGTPQVSGPPNETGMNELTIACGELSPRRDSTSENTDLFLPSGDNSEMPQLPAGATL
jgi:hypothetical protein